MRVLALLAALLVLAGVPAAAAAQSAGDDQYVDPAVGCDRLLPHGLGPTGRREVGDDVSAAAAVSDYAPSSGGGGTAVVDLRSDYEVEAEGPGPLTRTVSPSASAPTSRSPKYAVIPGMPSAPR